MSEGENMRRKLSIIVIILTIFVSFILGIGVCKSFLLDEINNNNPDIPSDTNVEKDEPTTYEEYLANFENMLYESGIKYEYPKDAASMGVISNLQYVLSLNKDKDLKLNDVVIASNVLTMYVLPIGNLGYQKLYFIDADGNLFKVNHEEYLNIEDTKLKVEELDYHDIILGASISYDFNNQGKSWYAVFTDINSNIYIDGIFKENGI